jgi:hypothetical protein
VGRADRRSGFTVPAATAHPRRIEPEAAIDRAAVELIEREPRAQGFDHIQVVLDGVEVARLHALDESLQVLADVAGGRIAAHQERPGSAAVLRRSRASPADTDGIGSLRLHGEPSLDSDLVLPRVAKIMRRNSKLSSRTWRASVGNEGPPTRPTPWSRPWMRKRWRWESVQPKAIWRVSWRAANVLSLRTRSRRPIMGLIWRIQTWSR